MSKPLKVVILSDLNWTANLRGLTHQDVHSFHLDDLKNPAFERLRRYLSIVVKEKSDLVLLAGDITGDGSCGHGFHNAVKIFLSILEKNKTPCLFISGNHDLEDSYQDLLSYTDQLNLSADISNKSCNLLGLNILGVSFDKTKSKSALNAFIKAQENNKYDIIIAHSELKRRIRLFELSAKYIITGHYDRKLFPFNDSIFISLDNDWEEVSYTTLEFYQKHPSAVTFKIRLNKTTTLCLSETFECVHSGFRNSFITVDGNQALDLDQIESYPDDALINDGENMSYLKYLRGANYQKVLHTLYKTKQDIPLLLSDIPANKMVGKQITPRYKVSKVLVKDYLNYLPAQNRTVHSRKTL